MGKRNIIVIGASAGGFEDIRQLIGNLPPDLDASIFIVWHMAANVRGILPQVINKMHTLEAANAIDQEPIQSGRVYVAPPDHHLILEKGVVRITRGPKENRFRPAVDPLFRSAALTYGPRVIGIVLSGALDDGSAGLWTIKQHGGIGIVQEPSDADVPSMPKNAIEATDVDYILPVTEMASVLTKLVNEEVVENNDTDKNSTLQRVEVRIAMEDKAFKDKIFDYGELTPYTCPECHGVLTALREGKRIRFRCHTGHAFSTDSLLAGITESIEEAIWGAVRNIQESILLLNRMGDHFAEANRPRVAALYFKKAHDAEQRAELLRRAVFDHEQLSADGIKEEAGEEGGE